MGIDLTAIADEDLTGLWRDVLREQERRRRLVDAPGLAAQRPRPLDRGMIAETMARVDLARP